MRSLSILAVALLSACAAPGPQLEAFHPNHQDQARYEREVTECEYEALKATGSYTPDTTGMRSELGRAISRGLDMRDRRIEIGLACMRARGYQFRPAGAASSAPPPNVYATSQEPSVHGRHAGHAINFARKLQCSPDPAVNMTENAGDTEVYWATCTDGRPLQIRCYLSGCVSLNR